MTRSPRIATARPKLSSASGVGLFRVWVGTAGVPLLMSYTYTLPASAAPVSSPTAPTATLVPEIATENPKYPCAVGLGLLIVVTGTVGDPLLRSNTYALPASAAPVLSR